MLGFFGSGGFAAASEKTLKNQLLKKKLIAICNFALILLFSNEGRKAMSSKINDDRGLYEHG